MSAANVAIVPSDNPIPPHESKECFQSLMEHWAKARIDGPMQAVARYDDAAKQLVTVGSLMQGLLVAAYSLMFNPNQGGAPSPGAWQVALILAFLISLVVFFVCTVGVCWSQPKMEAGEVQDFLLRTLRGCFSEHDINDLVESWCQDIDTIRRNKRWWLTGACISFMLCSVLMVALMLLPLMRA